MKKDLNPLQTAILNFIQKAIDERGYPPSVREIGEAVGLKSSSTVHNHLVNLQQKGYIKRDPTKPRAIEIVGNNNALVRVPIIGHITAGKPILALENIEDTFSLPVKFIRTRNVFMLKIRGNSMVNAGILDGDYVIVRQQNTAENSEIIVALLGDEVTVKRFYKESDHVRLQPENPDFEPIISKEVVVLGKVIGVLRKLDH